MAYVQDPTQEDDDPTKSGESQYAELLTGGTSAPAAGPAPAAAPTPAASRPGFVNFDRYLNANRDATQNAVNKGATDLENRAKGVQAGLGQVKDEIATAATKGTVQGPDTVTPSAATTQRDAINNMSYAGPKSGEIDSKYAALLTQKAQVNDQLRGGVGGLLGPKANSFDAALASGVGAESRVQDLKKQYGGLDTQYAESRGASEKAVSDASAASDAAKSKWMALLGEGDQQLKDIETAKQTAASNVTRSQWDVARSAMNRLTGMNAPSDGTRPRGEEVAAAIGNSLSPTGGQMLNPEQLQSAAATIDQMSDEELFQFLESPDRYVALSKLNAGTPRSVGNPYSGPRPAKKARKAVGQ